MCMWTRPRKVDLKEQGELLPLCRSIGRTDAETPTLYPPDVKSQLIGKGPDAGKDRRQKEKRATEDKMVR